MTQAKKQNGKGKAQSASGEIAVDGKQKPSPAAKSKIPVTQAKKQNGKGKAQSASGEIAVDGKQKPSPAAKSKDEAKTKRQKQSRGDERRGKAARRRGKLRPPERLPFIILQIERGWPMSALPLNKSDSRTRTSRIGSVVQDTRQPLPRPLDRARARSQHLLRSGRQGGAASPVPTLLISLVRSPLVPNSSSCERP